MVQTTSYHHATLLANHQPSKRPTVLDDVKIASRNMFAKCSAKIGSHQTSASCHALKQCSRIRMNPVSYQYQYSTSHYKIGLTSSASLNSSLRNTLPDCHSCKPKSLPPFTTISELANTPQTNTNTLPNKPLVKICGVTNPEDASLAARAGAHFIGSILWPHSKRSVSLSMAAEIAMAAREGGAQPVGVFVDEDAEAIMESCEATGISFAQLHGDNARLTVSQLPSSLEIIYVLHANANGEIQTPMPSLRKNGDRVEWVLVDGLQGGSGEKFDWENLQVPHDASSKGWILAGGLNPNNVAQAVGFLHPTVVDVSSGVTTSDKIKKDPQMVASFISEACSVSN